VNGRAYLVGLAMTDTPASLGTERLKFTAQQRQAVMTFNSVQGEAPLISEAIESEIIEMAEQRQEEGTQWFNRVPARCTCCLISPGRFPLTAGIATGRKRQSDRLFVMHG
ncbi:GPO family capsid scaffolding protein, partial [Escherichia coli]